MVMVVAVVVPVVVVVVPVVVVVLAQQASNWPYPRQQHKLLRLHPNWVSSWDSQNDFLTAPSPL